MCLAAPSPCRLSGHLLLNHGLCRRWGHWAPWGSASTLGALRRKGSKGLNPNPFPFQVWENLPASSSLLSSASFLCSQPTTRPPPKHNSLKPGQKGRDRSPYGTLLSTLAIQKSPETKKLSGLQLFTWMRRGGGWGVEYNKNKFQWAPQYIFLLCVCMSSSHAEFRSFYNENTDALVHLW